MVSHDCHVTSLSWLPPDTPPPALGWRATPPLSPGDNPGEERRSPGADEGSEDTESGPGAARRWLKAPGHPVPPGSHLTGRRRSTGYQTGSAAGGEGVVC